MKKTITPVLVSLLLSVNLFSQNLKIEESQTLETKISSSRNETEKRGIPSSVHIFNASEIQKIEDSYVLKFETSSTFTCFGIGWEASDINLPAGHFKIAYKNEVSSKDKRFGNLKTGEGETVPSENTTGMYWSELFFSYDETARKQLFIVITPPEDVSISKIRVDVMDLSTEIDSRHAKEMLQSSSIEKSLACPAEPSIIQRVDWCGSYTACTNASYTPTTITPTHTVIHHGASPDVYTDGYAVVRSYWNYHVNTLGWSDIGYNYLFDKFGNVFLGRKNVNYLTVDVQGAHAGNSNGKSIGINFLGNGDVTQPTSIQLQKVYELLAWWYKSRNLTPNSSASLILQSGGTAVVPRILGHKDTNIGGTACPGTTIYALLGTMRSEVTNIIDACNPVSLTPTNLQRTVSTCPENEVTFSWENSGTGWYIQVSSSSLFTNPYYKYVSNLTSYTGPTGFVLQSDGITPLSFVAGQTYYWRIWDNSSFTNGTSYTMNALPAQPGTISGTASVCSGTSNGYSIAAVNGASSYSWSVPSGSTISGGQGTTSITVTSGTTSGNISVTASNSCGTSTARTLAITATSCADVTKPTTSLTSPTWVSANFTATFTDADNTGGSGLKYRFYQVTDLNGTERRANKTFGFFNDNFNTAIHSDWTTMSGTWSVSGGVLKQQNEVSTNTNIYTSVTQTAGNQYLYNWKMKISGTGTNKRAGLHFFCEDAAQSNRLNSYMVYFRADGNVVQVYEYLNNVMYLRAEAPCTVTPGILYDYKVVLNAVTGEINVYQNNNFIVSWTDTTPLTIGNQVSLRTAECAVEYDDFRIFKSRGATATISAGNSTAKEIRYQNATSTLSSGQIVSLTTDVAKNISNESSKLVNLDFWGPYVLTEVRDGLTSTDISTQISTTSISANWNATTDPNNIVSSYSYAIGTTVGGTNIVNWTTNGTNLSFTKTGLTLTIGTTYYVSVRSTNAAGVISSVKTSNGVLIKSGLLPQEQENWALETEKNKLNIYPNPSSNNIYVEGFDLGQTFVIYDIRGQKILESNFTEQKSIDISSLIGGVYFISIVQNGKQVLERFVKN